MNAINLVSVEKSFGHYASTMSRLRELVTGRQQHSVFTALHPLSLEIEHGEVVGLVGMNGAGKSTLLKLIAGTMSPSSGSISVDGRVSALLELGGGFHPEMTGRENVYLSGSIMGLPIKQIDDLYADIVEFAGIREFMDQPVKTYSSGMFVRLAFSVATCVEPDVLIVDEALSVGDGAFARKSFDRIMNFKKAGKTILFCSHSLYQVEAICSRVIWIDQGHVMMDGAPSQVTAAYSEFLGLENKNKDAELHPKVQEWGPRQDLAINAGTARLLAVRISAGNKTGPILDLQSCQDDLQVEIEFSSDPKLPDPTLAVAFIGRDGRFIASAGTLNDGYSVSRQRNGSGKARVIFPKFSLLKGSYWVSAYLLCEDGIHAYDQANWVAELKVSQTGLEQGVVSLQRRWQAGDK